MIITTMMLLFGLTGCSEESTLPDEPRAEPAATDTTATPLNDTESGSERVLTLPAADLRIPEWAGQRADEPFDVRQFLMSRMPPEDNAAPLYLEALSEVSTIMDIVFTAEEWQARLPAVQALEQRIDDLTSSIELFPSLLDSGPVSPAGVEQLLEDTAGIRQKLDEAQQASGCVFVNGMGIEALSTHAVSTRPLAQLARIQICHASSCGDVSQAEPAIRRTLHLSRDLRPRASAIVQLVSLSLDSIVCASIREFALTCPELTVVQCDRLLKLLTEHQRSQIGVLGEAIRMEYITFRLMPESLARGTQHDRDTWEQMTGLVVDDLDWEAEFAAVGRDSAAYLELSDQPWHEWRRIRDAANPVDEELSDPDVKWHPFMFTPMIESLVDAAAQAEVRLAGTQLLIAIRRYQVATGELPESLEIATQAAGLESLPDDPYSGRPFGYTVIDNRPVVYSVGADQKDDGGLVDWNDGAQPGDFLLTVGH